MSSLARLVMDWGGIVSGSDRSDSELLESLRQAGAVISVGHESCHVTAGGVPDLVVYSQAIKQDNPELKSARDHGIPTMHRAEFLGHLMTHRRAVCVCGTHGKTTTTAMLASIIIDAGQDPCMMLGGLYAPIGGNSRSGKGSVFVAEACEAYDSFLSLYPDLAVVTNIEAEHVGAGRTFDDLRQSFKMFLGRVPESGTVVACVDSPEVVDLLPGLRSAVQTYGLSNAGDVQPDWTAQEGGPGWDVFFRGGCTARLCLPTPGLHNVSNALAAIAMAAVLGVDPQAAAATLGAFVGVDRRFSVRGTHSGVIVVDDYAHHPTEIEAALKAARRYMAGLPQATGRIVAAFQPHLYSRTQQLMDDFARVLGNADVVVLTDIYAAREEPIPGVTSGALADRTAALWPQKMVVYEPGLDGVPGLLARLAQPGDMALTLGAGDITDVGPRLLEILKAREDLA
jgi:UDP-N-acetylmuramate--alanine ligase